MEKLCYALWRDPGSDLDALRGAMLGEVGPQLLGLEEVEVAGLRMQIEDPAGDLLRYGSNEHRDRLFATVSVWMQSYDDRAPVEERIAHLGCRTAGWLVTESRPITWDERDWADGQRSPGLSLVTLLTKRPDITDDEFFERWHGSHTPLTFEIHPFTSYLRNVLVRALTPDAPAYRALVEEAVVDAEDLTDLHRFYRSGGVDDQLKANIQRMNDDLVTFCDLANLETCPAGEWILKSGPGD